MLAWEASTSRFRISAIPWTARPLRSRRPLSGSSAPQTAAALRFDSMARLPHPAPTDWGVLFLAPRCTPERLRRRRCYREHSRNRLPPPWTRLLTSSRIPPCASMSFPNPRLYSRSPRGCWLWACGVYIGADSEYKGSLCDWVSRSGTEHGPSTIYPKTSLVVLRCHDSSSDEEGHLMQRFVVIFAAIGILGGLASAEPSTYTLTTTAIGTLGASTFTDASVTVTLTGNTSNIAFGPSPLNVFLVNPGSATINISGLGTSTFTDSIEILSSFDTLVFGGKSAVVIAQLDNPAGTSVSGIAVEEGTAFFGYSLQGPFGPISGTGGAASGPANIFLTSAGN